MPSTTCTRIAAAAAFAALAACAPATDAAGPRDVILAGAPSAELDFAARGVEDGLRSRVGPQGGGALTEVRRDGGTVTAVVALPLPAAELSAAQREAASGAIRDTFVSDVCGRAGLDGFFALGGTLRIEALGSDGAALADLPLTSCV